MHLWPSIRLRESFKIGYLTKTEWNLRRMNSEKKSSSQPSTPSTPNSHLKESLLDSNNIHHHEKNGVVAGPTPWSSSASKTEKAGLILREILMVLTCCYCCFGCGACVDQDVE